MSVVLASAVPPAAAVEVSLEPPEPLLSWVVEPPPPLFVVVEVDESSSDDPQAVSAAASPAAPAAATIVRRAGLAEGLNDALVTVRTAGNLNENVNIGSAQYYGGEIGLDADLAPNLQIGINYSYIHRSFDVGTAPPGGFIRLFRLTDVPDHKGFAYISWKPIKQITVPPSLEFSSERMTVTAATANGNAPVYYELPGYVNAAMRVDYDINDNLTLGVGVRNLFDKYYTLTDGFPEPGRSFFLTARARY